MVDGAKRCCVNDVDVCVLEDGADFLFPEAVEVADDQLPLHPKDLRIELVARLLVWITNSVDVVFEEMSQQRHADDVGFRVANEYRI